tara:strand:- start:14851 stop:16611 length:1761 start_codon:yes stop_codon:yes gene_type:complete
MLSTPKYAGEPSVEALASGLATLGRYGDEYMVHAAEGETVIPKEVLDSNPQLKRDLFRQMMMMGIEDPNRYVVGSNLNSINPVTGQPEFFFKKIFKAVKKVFKKALPIIAPIVGNMIAPGIGGIVASGLVTKLQGGSWGDALKSAGISWATQGLMGGIGGAMSPTGTFMGGLQQGLTTPFTAASNLFSSGPLNPLQQGIFGSAKSLAGAGMFGKTLTPRYNPDALAGTGLGGLNPSGSVGTATGTAGQTVVQPGSVVQTSPVSDFLDPADLGSDYGTIAQDPFMNMTAEAQAATNPTQFMTAEELYKRAAAAPVPAAPTAPTTTTGADLSPPAAENTGIANSRLQPEGDLSVLDRAKQYTPWAKPEYTVGDTTLYGDAAILQSQQDSISNAQKLLRQANVQEGSDLWNSRIKEAMEVGKSNAMPGIVQKYGGAAALGLGAAYLGGAFDYAEEEEELRNKNLSAASEEMEAYDKWKRISDKNSPEAQDLYFKWHGQPTRTRSQFEYLTGGKSARPDWMFVPELPGRYDMGGEVIGPGTGTSDSIPARLSDGEFVMTAEAVRNAGGGDRNLGAARMYDMMRRFEGGTA